MVVVVRILTGALILAHGLVHLLYLAPDVPQFSCDRSWLVGETRRGPLGLTLMAGTVAAFMIVAFAVWGVPGLSEAWPALTLVAGLLSAALMITFWNPQLVFGLALDAGLIVIAVSRPDWAQHLLTAR
ncbi:MAG: hypothetical protein WAL50_01625 [Kineosporiaceae bacterium]